MTPLPRIRVVSPYSAHRNKEGKILRRYPDGAVAVRLEGVELPMVFGVNEVEELGSCALCGRADLTEAEAAGCEDCTFAGGGKGAGRES